MVDNAFAKHGQPWLTEVPFHKPMVDHGWPWFRKALPNHGQPWLTMVLKSFAKPWSTMVNHGWLTNHGQPWSTFKYLFLPFLSENPMSEPWPAKLRLVQVPSLLVENRYKGSLLTWDSFVQTGVQWLHKGKFQSLQTCIKMSICVKPIFLHRHILWCQESKVGSVWKWNNQKTTNWHMSCAIFKAI